MVLVPFGPPGAFHTRVDLPTTARDREEIWTR